MKPADIVDTLITKLTMPGGRHLYGILGTYAQLDEFASLLTQARAPSGIRFPKAINVNKGILDTIPDSEFKELCENEARRPEPTRAHVAMAFEKFLRQTLAKKGLLVLANLEMVFAYQLELNMLRTMAADEDRIILLLPGRRVGGAACGDAHGVVRGGVGCEGGGGTVVIADFDIFGAVQSHGDVGGLVGRGGVHRIRGGLHTVVGHLVSPGEGGGVGPVL
jgi:hypothetical protein